MMEQAAAEYFYKHCKSDPHRPAIHTIKYVQSQLRMDKPLGHNIKLSGKIQVGEKPCKMDMSTRKWVEAECQKAVKAGLLYVESNEQGNQVLRSTQFSKEAEDKRKSKGKGKRAGQRFEDALEIPPPQPTVVAPPLRVVPQEQPLPASPGVIALDESPVHIDDTSKGSPASAGFTLVSDDGCKTPSE
jgi:hypothetical protein